MNAAATDNNKEAVTNLMLPPIRDFIVRLQAFCLKDDVIILCIILFEKNKVKRIKLKLPQRLFRINFISYCIVLMTLTGGINYPRLKVFFEEIYNLFIVNSKQGKKIIKQ